jgi:hypothetical protein
MFHAVARLAVPGEDVMRAHTRKHVSALLAAVRMMGLGSAQTAAALIPQEPRDSPSS